MKNTDKSAAPGVAATPTESGASPEGNDGEPGAVESIPTEPRNGGVQGDERIRTADRFGCTSESEHSRTASGWVYFLQPKFNEEGPVKVGYSADPIRRLREHNNRLREEPLALVGAFPANRDEERELHRRWRQHRVLGEWFRPAPEIRAAIDLAAALHFEEPHRG